METLFDFVEIGASYIENLLIFGFISRVAGRKYAGRKQGILILAFSLLLTGVVTILNSIRAFSFYTIFVGVFLFISLSKITSTGNVLLRSTACALAFFFMHTLDYLTGFSTALLFGDPTDINESFLLLMQPGTTRLAYTLVDKGIQIALYFVLYPVYRKITVLSRKYLAVVLVITVSAYAMMSILLNMIITDSIVVLQIAVLLSWLFIMLCLIAVICSVTISTQYYSQKQETEMMAVTNDLMMKNYQQLYDVQIRISQQVHDFTNHLKTLNGLIGDGTEAKTYVQTLLQAPKRQVRQSQCGNHVIDAIVNCKAEEALNSHIVFSWQITIQDPEINISSVDICAVLSNQIDNAFEACEKISRVEDRFVSVEIWKRESFVFFKVINSVDENPFDKNHRLVSKKKSTNGMHGLGIKNIQDVAGRYEGSVEMTYHNGRFISTVMLQETK